MKKKLLSLILTACMLLGMLPGAAGATETTWDGTAKTEVTPVDNVYTITTVAQLAWVASVCNAGTNDFSGKTVKLDGDIDLGNQPWTPIGISSQESFKGSFDGGGHTVSNLAVGTAELPYSGQYAGLFGYVMNSTTLTFQNVSVTGAVYSTFKPTSQFFPYAGLLAGAMTDGSGTPKSTLTNCHVAGTVEMTVNETGGSLPTSFLSMGGLTGTTNFIVDGCSATSVDKNPATALVTLNLTYAGNMSEASVGGLFGSFSGKLYNSYAVGGVTVKNASANVSGQTGTVYLGGMVGYLGDAVVGNSFTRATLDTTGYIATGPTQSLGNFSGNGTMGKATDSYAVAAKTKSTEYSDYDELGIINTADTADAITAAFGGDYNAVLDARNSARPRPAAAYSTWETDTANGGLPHLTGTKPLTPDWADEGLTAVSATDYLIADNTITIKTEKGLGWLAANALMYGGGWDPYHCYKGYTILLDANLDLSAKPWVPVGTKLLAGDKEYYFAGVFDGQGHTITGMTSPTADHQRLFVENGGFLFNLGLSGGGLAKTHTETIVNCWASNSSGNLADTTDCGTIVSSFSVNSGDGSGQYFGNVYNALVGEAKTVEQLKEAAFATLLNTTAQSLTDKRPAAYSRPLCGWEAADSAQPAFGAVLTATKDWVDVANGTGGDAAAPGTDYVVAGDTYTIKTAKGLAWLSGVSLGVITRDAPDDRTFEDKTILLDGDIDLSGHNWVPIGADTGGSGATAVFSGIFDGQGHKISGLTINNNVGINDSVGRFAAAGLFGAVADAVIRNVTVENPAITLSGGNYKVGALVGKLLSDYYGALVDNCHVVGGSISATSDGAMNIGGLVGCNLYSQVINSSVSAATDLTMTVTGGSTAKPPHSAFAGKNLGGLVGDSEHENSDNCILNSWSRADLKVEGSSDAAFSVGGIVGALYKETIINNYFGGTITVAEALTATTGKLVGGIAGYDYWNISTFTNNFYLTGTATTGLGYRETQNPADVPGKTDAKNAAELKDAALLNHATAIVAVAAAVENANSGAMVRYWKLDGAVNDGYPLHKAPEAFTTQPTTAALTVAVTNPTGVTYGWEKETMVKEPTTKKRIFWDEASGAWKTDAYVDTWFNVSMVGNIDSDAEGKINFKWKVQNKNPYSSVLVYIHDKDGCVTTASAPKGTAHSDYQAVCLTDTKIKPNTTYEFQFGWQLANAGSEALFQFSDTQPIYYMTWETISGQTAATLNPTGISKGTPVRCTAAYPWGEAITSDTAKVGDAPAAFDPINGGVTIQSEYIYANGNAITLIQGGDDAKTNILYDLDEGKSPITLTGFTGDTTNGYDLTGAKIFGGAYTGDSCASVTTSVTMEGGKVKELRAGGNYNAPSAGTLITMKGGDVLSGITGGGNAGDTAVSGQSKIVMTGGSVGTIDGYWNGTVGSVLIQLKGGTIRGSVSGWSGMTAEPTGGARLELSGSITVGEDVAKSIRLDTFTDDKVQITGALIGGTGKIRVSPASYTETSVIAEGVSGYNLTATDSAAFEHSSSTWGWGVKLGETNQIVSYLNEAQYTPESGTKTSGTFAAALAAMKSSGGSIKLLKDVTVPGVVTITTPVTLDLGGKTLTGSLNVSSGGSLTLKATGGGTVSSGTRNALTIADGGTAAITGGTLTSTDANPVQNSGTLSLAGTPTLVSTAAFDFYSHIMQNGGTISAKVGDAYFAKNGAGNKKLTIGYEQNKRPAADDTLVSNVEDDTAAKQFSFSIPEPKLMGVYDVSSKNIVAHTYYTVIFDDQGATTGALPNRKNVITPAAKIDALPIPPVKTGFTFGGWYTEINGGGTKFTADTTVSADITVYAKWTEDVIPPVFVPVTDITGVPTAATAGKDLTLTGTVAPANATNTAIVWSVRDAGETGATIAGSTLKTTGAGTVVVTATIANGATESTDYTKDFTITVTAVPATYTVTYNGNGSTGGTVPVDGMAYAKDAIVIVLGNTGALVKTQFAFTGWNTKADGTGTDYAAGNTFAITADTTLYAKWTPVFDVGGDIKDSNDDSVDGAAVTIKLGNTKMGTAITNADGAFTIVGIPNGVYQLIIQSGELTVTKTITVAGANLAVGTVKLPAGKQNSVVKVMPGTPDIVVGGLDEQFEVAAAEGEKGVTEADKAVITGGGAVEIKLTVESKTDTALGAEDIKQAAGGKPLAFLDLSVKKTVTPSGGGAAETTLTELQTLLTVRIPLSPAQQGKSDYTIYRYHGNKVDAITNTANAEGEKLELMEDGKTLQLLTNKFSTYAIAYSETVTPPPTDTGSGVTTYTITATAGEGGSISPKGTVRVDRNADKTFTVTPGAGYEIADVLVDGKSAGAIATYTFEKVTAKHTIEAKFRKEVKNPFTDVTEDDWFHDAVLDALDKGLMEGTAADKFSPYLTTDRGMIVTILWRLEGSPDVILSGAKNDRFADVPADAYYAKAIAWGAENGIVRGYDTGKFGPADPITREQLAAILHRYAQFKGMGAPAKGGLSKFIDQPSDWAAESVRWCVGEGLISGKGNDILDPTGKATRAETAAVLCRYMTLISSR